MEQDASFRNCELKARIVVEQVATVNSKSRLYVPALSVELA